MQEEQEKYKKAYQNRYAKYRLNRRNPGASSAAVSLTNVPGTQPSVKLMEKSSTPSLGDVTSTKEFPYKYQNSWDHRF